MKTPRQKLLSYLAGWRYGASGRVGCRRHIRKKMDDFDFREGVREGTEAKKEAAEKAEYDYGVELPKRPVYGQEILAA